MSTERLRDVFRFYDTALREGRGRHEQVGWESAAVQHLRFEALLEAVNHGDYSSRITLLDVGCGMGDLVGWLEETRRHVQYTGIDVHPDMVARACERWGGRDNVCFEVADLLDWEPDRQFDIVLCSGALSICFDSEESSWEFIDKLYDLARWVATFNLQSDRAIEVPGAAAQRTDFWHVDPAEVFVRLRKGCRNLVLREDTVPSDLVVWMYQDYCRTLRASRLNELEQAEVFLQRGEHDQALEALRFAETESTDRKARAAYLRGVCQAHLGDEQGARRGLEEAHELAPDDLDIIESLVHFSLTTEDEGRARQLVAALPSDGPGAGHRDDIRMPLHEVHIAADRPTDAEALEEQAETLFAAALMKGSRALAERRNQEAVSWLEQAVDAAPWDGRPLTLLGASYVRTNQPARAVECLVSALHVSPNSNIARTLGLDAMRRLAQLAKRGDEQARDVLQSVADHPVLGRIAQKLIADLPS